MLSHVAGARLAAAPSVLIAIPETINNWSPTADLCHLPGGLQAPANAHISFQQEVHERQQVPLVMGKTSKKKKRWRKAQLWSGREAAVVLAAEPPTPSSNLWSRRGCKKLSLRMGTFVVSLRQGLPISSAYTDASTAFKVEKNKKKCFKNEHWKAPQIFLYQWQDPKLSAAGGRVGWENSLQDERFHSSPPAKICVTLSMLRGCQLPLSHLPHGKSFEQLQQKKKKGGNVLIWQVFF